MLESESKYTQTEKGRVKIRASFKSASNIWLTNGREINEMH